MNVLTIQMRFAGEARPSAVTIELEDIWGEVEIGTLSSINVWTWNIRPDRPQVTKIRLQPEGSGDDVISMKLSIHACAEGRLGILWILVLSRPILFVLHYDTFFAYSITINTVNIFCTIFFCIVISDLVR